MSTPRVMESAATRALVTDDAVGGWGYFLLAVDCIAFWAVLAIVLVALLS